MPSAWFPLRVHNAAPPSLHGVREGPFLHFKATMGRSDSLTSLSPYFVPSLGDTIVSSPDSSPQAFGTAARVSTWVGKPGLRPAVTMETARSPTFP